MDDIPFFDTTSYGLRGGIFADAFSRAGGASSPVEDSATTGTTGTAAAATSTATDSAGGSTSPNTNTTSLSRATEGDSHTSHDALHISHNNHDHTEAPLPSSPSSSLLKRHRTLSVDAVSRREHATTAGGVSEGENMVRATTIGGTAASGGARKRRTWFGKREDSGEWGIEGGSGAGGRGREKAGSDASANPKVVVTLDGEGQQDEKRVQHVISTADGASGGAKSSTKTAAGLSTSAPTPSSGMSSASWGAEASENAPPTSHGRSPSDAGSSASDLVPASSPTPPPPLPPPQSSSSPSSFLNTLKARSAGMAEKQPVLKEAMRKWGVGVNWAAGLRKDGAGGRERVREGEREERERERERGREEADHGEFWDGGREGSGGEGSVRGSYADLRRKVEEREQERLRNASGSGSAESGSISGHNNHGGGARPATRPIDIPGAEQQEQDRDGRGFPGGSPSPRRAPSVRSDTSISSIRKMSPQSSGGGFLSPTAPRTTTELHTSVRTPSGSPRSAEFFGGAAGVGPGAGGLLLDEREGVPTPIQVMPIRAQPKGATMTIPGIHARHRGEVMALGSGGVKGEEGSDGSGNGDGKGARAGDGEGGANGGAGKTIQSVYRLLRRGNGPGQAGGEAEGPGDVKGGSVPSGEGVAVNASGSPNGSGGGVPPSPSPSTPATTTTPILPPPLPPRGAVHGVAQGMLVDGIDSPASQALKSVVQQDAAARQPPPPLPIRRGSEHTSSSGDITNSPTESGGGSSGVLIGSSSGGSIGSSPSASIPTSLSASLITSSPATSTSVPSTTTLSSASDREGAWVPLTADPESLSSASFTQVAVTREEMATAATVPPGNEKWRPPLPPRKSSGSINRVQT